MEILPKIVLYEVLYLPQLLNAGLAHFYINFRLTGFPLTSALQLIQKLVLYKFIDAFVMYSWE